MTWRIVFAKQAVNDARNLAAAGLKAKAQAPFKILSRNPFRTPPPHEKLIGDLDGAYSRRLNIEHRLVDQVLRSERTVKVLRMWTYYE